MTKKKHEPALIIIGLSIGSYGASTQNINFMLLGFLLFWLGIGGI